MWKLSQNQNYPDQGVISQIVQKGISPLIVEILVKRGYNTVSDMLDFLRPSLLNLHSPFLFKDMAKVVDRLRDAQDEQEKILVYGDYDADGITGTALLYQALFSFGFNVLIHIPSREEGYGLHNSVIEKAYHNGVKLIITVDCGITAVEESLYARDKGIELIITDHHEPPEELPEVIGIINPKVVNSGYPFTQLAGVGVVYKVVQALYSCLSHTLSPSALTEVDYLDLVALGTIADLVPLIDENRIFVKYGLQVMENSKNIGLCAMLQECGLQDKRLKAGQVSFIIAPRINAAGRMDTARLALNLLLEKDLDDALATARELSRENYQRQQIEKEIVEEVAERISQAPLPHVIVISSPTWHHGVIGIVASRLVERFHRPVFIISEEGDTGKGSARGITDYHVLDELRKQDHLLTKYGGHKQAAGFSLPVANIDELRMGLNNSLRGREICFKPQYTVDTQVTWDSLTLDLIHHLEQLAPFGMGNPAPAIMSIGLRVEKLMTIGKNQEHLKLILSEGQARHEVVAFKRGNEFEQLKNMDIIDIIYNLEINNYMNEERVQAILKDYRSGTPEKQQVPEGYSLIPDQIACAIDATVQTARTEEESDFRLSRQVLVDFYLHLKGLFQDREIISWTPDSGYESAQFAIVKIFEELGLVKWLGGTNPYILSLNKVNKTQLDKSLRYQLLS